MLRASELTFKCLQCLPLLSILFLSWFALSITWAYYLSAFSCLFVCDLFLLFISPFHVFFLLFICLFMSYYLSCLIIYYVLSFIMSYYLSAFSGLFLLFTCLFTSFCWWSFLAKSIVRVPNTYCLLFYSLFKIYFCFICQCLINVTTSIFIIFFILMSSNFHVFIFMLFYNV